MRGFTTYLNAMEIGEHRGRAVWSLDTPLIFMLDDNRRIEIPIGFETDLASVPRVPIAYWLWGGRAHREAVMHDYLYRIDAYIDCGREGKIYVSKADADWYFRLAMKSESPDVHKKAQPYYVYQPMYWGVKFGGGSSYHRMMVMDKFKLD
jgi:hypothetical protein